MNTKLIQKFVSSSVLRIFFIVCSAGVAYFMLPFLSQNLGAHNYGIWAVALTIIGYYGFLDFGISSSVGRFVGQAYGHNDEERINIITATAFWIFIGIMILGMLLTVGGAFISKYHISDPNDIYSVFYVILLLGLGVSTQFPVRAIAGIVYASVDHHLIVSVELIKLVFKTTLMIMFIMQGHGLIALAMAVFLTEVLGNLLQISLIFRMFPNLSVKWKHASKGIIRPLLDYSWVAFVARLSEMLKIKFMPVLVSSFISVEFVVFYVVALRLMEYLNQLIATITGILAPVVSRFEDSIESLQMTYKHAGQVVVLISFYIGLTTAFYSKWLIPLWMGEGFDVSYTLTVMLCIPFIMISIQRIPREILFGISKHKYCAIVNIIQFAVLVALGYILNSLYGYYGIALAFAISMIAGELIFPIIVSSILGMSIRRTYYNVFFIPALKVTLPMVIFFFYANDFVESTYMSLAKWNLIQFIVMLPILYISLPLNVRRKLFGPIERKVAVFTSVLN